MIRLIYAKLYTYQIFQGLAYVRIVPGIAYFVLQLEYLNSKSLYSLGSRDENVDDFQCIYYFPSVISELIP